MECIRPDTCDECAIWEAAIDTAIQLNAPSQTVAATLVSAEATPVKSSTGRFAETETRKILREELLEEMRYRTFRHVSGFVDKLFSTEQWTADQQRMYDNPLKNAHNGTRWKLLPADQESMDEETVRSWLISLLADYLPDSFNKLHYTDHASEIQRLCS